MRVGSKYLIQVIIAKISKITGITKLFYKLNKNRKKIIAYHNIIPDEFYNNYVNLICSTKESNFTRQLEIIKENFNVGLDFYNNNEVTLTFDDGYLNQYKIASKILDSKDIKGYFFLASNLLEKEDMLLIDKIQYWIDYVPCGIYVNKELNINEELNDLESRQSNWIKVNNLIHNNTSMKKICDILNDIYPFDKIKINNQFYNLRFTPITKANLEEMKRNGHKIGAHSASHQILSQMSKEEINHEIDTCYNMLGTVYNTKTFCYPYGGEEEVSSEVINIVKSRGFENAISFQDYLSNNKEFSNYFIPRITIPDTYDKDVIEFVLSGVKYFIKYRRLFPKF